MALTTCMVNTCKANFLAGVHLAANAYKMALVKVGHAGTYDTLVTAAGTPGTGAPTTSNLGTDEVAASGSYTAGGFAMAGYAAGATTTTSWIDWTTDPSFTSATISAVGAMLYNDTVAGKPVLTLHDFGGTVTSTAGTFTITLPAAAAATALVRIA
jgi:hypothetical protein